MVFFAALMVCFGHRYPDRADFLRKLRELPDGASESTVLRVLGKPDRIEQSSGSYYEEGEIIKTDRWSYGTDSNTGAATLAEISFAQGKLGYHAVTGELPSSSVISEEELRRGIHLVLDNFPREFSSSNVRIAQWVVKSVNGLLPFGEAKSKAIIGECGRLKESSAQLSPNLYFLTFALFDPPKPPGHFNSYDLVWRAFILAADQLKHPRWPDKIVGNTLVIHGLPLGGFGGYAPSFASSYAQIRSKIHLRKTTLTVPG